MSGRRFVFCMAALVVLVDLLFIYVLFGVQP